MDFEEFYWAIGNNTSYGILKQFFEQHHALNESHRKVMRDLRLYMLVGGMPQAVDTYLSTNNLQAVDEKKREIIDLYKDDFNKIDPTGRASQLFAAIPAQLNSNAGRYQIANVLENQDAQRVAEVVADMADSMTISLAYHANDPNVGLPMTKNLYRYKMFVADTGLFVTLAFHDKAFTENIIYSKLLSDKLDANLGYIYENLVAQMLRSAGHELFYHTFPAENNHNYEVDFLLSRGNKIVPVEVKSSGYTAHKSLDAFCDKYSSRIGDRILLYTKDYQKDRATICLPIYFTSML